MYNKTVDNKKLPIIIALLVLVAGGVAFWYWSHRKVQKTVEPGGTIGAAQEASKSVPEIQTNPGQKVPEINPLDRANPFKYTNPLR